MAELEIHHEHEGHDADPLGRKIGVLASVLAVFLAIVTISSHRAHTDAVLHKADANDKWAYYQSKRIKFHNIELGLDIAGMIGAKDPEAGARVERFKKERERYAKESDDVQKEARDLEAEVGTLESKALRFDIGEGLIEIGLVLSSLYFISKKKYFPSIGVIAGVAGIVIAASGLLVH
jgi:hypothetical protein